MENKKACNKLTFEEVNKRFVEQGRTDIELCEDGFCGWTKKCFVNNKNNH